MAACLVAALVLAVGFEIPIIMWEKILIGEAVKKLQRSGD